LEKRLQLRPGYGESDRTSRTFLYFPSLIQEIDVALDRGWYSGSRCSLCCMSLRRQGTRGENREGKQREEAMHTTILRWFGRLGEFAQLLEGNSFYWGYPRVDLTWSSVYPALQITVLRGVTLPGSVAVPATVPLERAFLVNRLHIRKRCVVHAYRSARRADVAATIRTAVAIRSPIFSWVRRPKSNA
jgi:hypothetical protein